MPGTLDRRTFISRSAAVAGGSVLFGRANFSEEPVEGMTCAVTGPWHRGPL